MSFPWILVNVCLSLENVGVNDSEVRRIELLKGGTIDVN